MSRVPQTTPTGSLKGPLSFALHLTSCCVLGWAWIKLDRLPVDAQSGKSFTEFMNEQYGGKLLYLTNLGLLLALSYFAVSLLKHLLPSVHALDALKNGIGSLVVPLEGLVSVLYWSIMTFDPTLMVPPGFEGPPFALDLALHAAPAFCLWIDFLCFSPPFSEATRPTLTAIVLGTGYIGFLEYCAKKNGYYAYPLFNDLSLAGRAAFYIVSVVVEVALFHAAQQIHLTVDRMLERDSKDRGKKVE